MRRFCCGVLCALGFGLGCDRPDTPVKWNRLVDSVRVLSVAENSGSLWVGTDAGLIRVDEFGKTVFTPSNSPLPELKITKLMTDDDGDLWIVNGSGGTWKYDGSEWMLMTVDAGLPGDKIVDIERGTSELLFAAVDGIASYHDHAFTPYHPPGASWTSHPFTSIARDDVGNIWVGTFGGGLIQIQDSVWTAYNPANSGLQSLIVYDIQPDGNHGIWIGEGGLTHYQDNIWTTFSIANSPLPQNDVVALGVRNAGEIWLGTMDEGVVRIRNHTWNIFQTTNSILPSNRISAIVMLPQHVLIGSSFGAVEVRF